MKSSDHACSFLIFFYYQGFDNLNKAYSFKYMLYLNDGFLNELNSFVRICQLILALCVIVF